MVIKRTSLVIKASLENVLARVVLTRSMRNIVQQLGQFYGARRFEKDRDIFSRKQEVSLTDEARYLPDTAERIERLRRLINGRPVAIILHGASVQELENRISELANCDICYATVNDLETAEKNILRSINRNVSIYMCGQPDLVRKALDSRSLIDFLERSEDNLLISGRGSFFQAEMTMGLDLDNFVRKYDSKLLFVVAPKTTYITMEQGFSIEFPSAKYPLHFPRQASLAFLVSLAVIGRASKVVVFGGDGGRVNDSELYYRRYIKAHLREEDTLAIDVNRLNVSMPMILNNIGQVYGIWPIEIINCSERSHYTPFRKLSYDTTFALLKGGG